MQQQQQLGPGLRLPTAAGGHARLWHHLGRARRRCPPTSAACLAQLKGAPPWCTTSTTPCSRSRVLAHAAAASQWFPSSVDAQGAPKQRYDAGTAAPSVELHLDKAASPLARLLAWWTLRSPSPDAAQEEAAEGGPARTKLLPLIGKIISLVAPERLMLLLATVFMVLAAAAELAIPHFATSCIFAAAGQGATDAAFKGTLRLLTGIIICYGVMSALRGYCFSILNNRMTMRLRTLLFANLVRRDVSFFDSTDTGSLTSRLQADCQAMTKCVATNLNIAFRNSLQAIGGLVYLAMTSPIMCAATLGVCVTLWTITLLYGEYARRTQKVFQDTLASANQVAEEVLSLSRVVRTFGTEQVEESRYQGWLRQLYNVGLRQATGYGMFVVSGHITCYMTKVVALAIGCAFIVQGTLTAEQLTNFIFYVEFVTYASLSACDEVVEVMEAVGASERVLALLEQPPAATVASGERLPAFSGRVELRDVSFSYVTRPNHQALAGVNLTLQPGQLVALVGLSGSGKTTLVALLQRLYDPTAGAVLVDGVDLRTVDANWYRSQIGVVNQEPKLFGMSVAANIAYGSGSEVTPEEIVEAARQANAHEFIMALPQKYDTKVTDRLLSGGQKQRIALARALVRKPKLLVLDEATSALDAESEAQVQSALDAAMRAKDRTVVVIAHRLSTVRNADVTVVMDKGRIVEQGTHASLLQQGGIYAKLVSRQQYDNGRAPAGLAQGTLAAAAAALGALGAGRPSGGGLRSYTGNGSGSSSTDDELLGSSAGRLSGVTSGDESSRGISPRPSVARHMVVANGTNGGNGAAAGGNGDGLELPAGMVVGPDGMLITLAPDPAIQVAAAAAVTAENELSSKVLGSQDPIDHTTNT